MMQGLPGGRNDFGGSCLMHGLFGWSPHGGGYPCAAVPEGVGAVLRSDDGGESMVFLVANKDMDGLLFEGRWLQGLDDAVGCCISVWAKGFVLGLVVLFIPFVLMDEG